MKFSTSTKLFGIVVVSLLMIVSASSDAMAQGRGHGRGNAHFDKKCEKFVNCHDARDGRLDGRGPDRDRFDNRYRRHGHNRDFDNDSWRRRHRNSDDWRRRQRDFDNNHGRRHRG
jgi:hypothetical protein